ncbi:MAG: UDP-N-acetylglucosamine 1-carboxyvinyltransferase, partial [Halanaerobium sp. MSAO_Bac5]
MGKYLITGENALQGELKVGGAKNAALPIIASALLADSTSVLEDIPRLRDVTNLCRIIEDMGAEVERKEHQIKINPTKVYKSEADHDLARTLRASYYILGVMLAKEGHARTTLPGGCNIGNRPIDLHLKGFRALGADVRLDHGVV